MGRRLYTLIDNGETTGIKLAKKLLYWEKLSNLLNF